MKEFFKKLENPYKNFNTPKNIKTAYINKPLYKFIDSAKIYTEEGVPLYKIKGGISVQNQKLSFYNYQKTKIQTIKEKTEKKNLFLNGAINGNLIWIKPDSLISDFNNWQVKKHRKTYYILSENNVIATITKFKGKLPYYENGTNFQIKYSTEEKPLTVMVFALAVILHICPSKTEQTNQIIKRFFPMMETDFQ